MARVLELETLAREHGRCTLYRAWRPIVADSMRLPRGEHAASCAYRRGHWQRCTWTGRVCVSDDFYERLAQALGASRAALEGL